MIWLKKYTLWNTTKMLYYILEPYYLLYFMLNIEIMEHFTEIKLYKISRLVIFSYAFLNPAVEILSSTSKIERVIDYIHKDVEVVMVVWSTTDLDHNAFHLSYGRKMVYLSCNWVWKWCSPVEDCLWTSVYEGFCLSPRLLGSRILKPSERKMIDRFPFVWARFSEVSIRGEKILGRDDAQLEFLKFFCYS